jgi:hypothetical protein
MDDASLKERHMLSRYFRVILLVGLLFVFTTACALTNVIADRFTGNTVDTVEETIEEEVSQPSEPVEAAPEPQPEPAPTEPALPFYQAGDVVAFNRDTLTALESYRSEFSLRSSREAGKDTDFSRQLEIVEEQVFAEQKSHYRISGDEIGGDRSMGIVAFYRFGETSYAYTTGDEDEGAAVCSMFDAIGGDENFAGGLIPEDLFNSFEIEELIAVNDVINSVAAQRYSLRSVDLAWGTTSRAMGEVWIAQEGQYIVRFVGEATGEYFLWEEEVEGTLEWDYQVKMINALEDIALPPECVEQENRTEFPLPESAGNRTSFGNFISFESTGTPQAVAEFYRERLPEEGWTIQSENAVGSFIQMTVQGSGRQAQITISPGDSGAAVVIIFEPE